MTARFFLAQLGREMRGGGGRFLFFALCLAIGVAAVVAVASLAAGVEQALRREARPLLAADLKIESRRPLPPAAQQAIAQLGEVRRAEVVETLSVVAAPSGKSALAELKFVGEGYPFYGELALRPGRPLGELLAGGGAVAAPELVARLGLAVGDTIQVGGQPFVVRALVDREPDRIAGTFSLGPRLFLDHAALAATGLLGRGARAEYRSLLALPSGTSNEATRAAAGRLRAALSDQPGLRVETYLDAQPGLRQSLARAERFLGLVALLSLLVGGVGVAQTVASWLDSRIDSIAILKCLGVRPREVLALFLAQLAALGLFGSAVGVAAGFAVVRLLPRFLGDLLPASAALGLQPAAALQGLLLGCGVALLFSLPPLLGALRVPAARVLRRTAEPVPASRWATAALLLALAAGVAAVAAVQADSLRDGALFTVGLALVAALLGGAAVLLVRTAARLPRRKLGLISRTGLAGLARPDSGTFSAMVALGLGIVVVVAMWVVQSQLTRQLAGELPADAPTAFLIDIQPDQWPGVEALLSREGATKIVSVPVVMARLAAIDGRSTADLARAVRPEDRGRRWALTREQRLTSLERLPPDNTIVAGALWSDPERAELSVEEEFARDLGLTVGSRLTLDLQGVPIELSVTSLRQVRWESFGINFFLVVEPGVLDRAPQQRLAAARLPLGGEQRVQDAMALGFPNVTLLQVRELLEKVTSVLQKAGTGVRALGAFTVLAGIAILIGAASATAARRGRETALLKALGMRRREVIGVFATEFGLIGLVAGAIGASAGGLLAWTILRQGMEMAWRFEPAAYLVALAASGVLAIAAGLVGSARALAERPIEALRHEE